MALNLPLPKRVFGHPWLLMGLEKMSKSRGNIAYADDLVKEFGVDAVRYYMLHEIPFSSDGNFSIELLENVINSDLANTLGNLVNRTLGMINKYNDGIVIKTNFKGEFDQDLIDTCYNSYKNTKEKMDELRIADSLDEIFNIFKRANKYIDETCPWTVAKDETRKDELNNILYNLIESIRYGTVLLQAFLPSTSKNIFEQINTDKTSFESLNEFGQYKTNTHINEPKVLFQRIDNKK